LLSLPGPHAASIKTAINVPNSIFIAIFSC